VALVLAEPLLPQVGEEAAPLVRGIADAEGVDRLGRDAALAEVFRHGLAAWRAAQGLAEVERRRVVGLKQPIFELALLGRAARQLDTGAIGEFLERFRRRKTSLLFEPGENIAPFTTVADCAGHREICVLVCNREVEHRAVVLDTLNLPHTDTHEIRRSVLATAPTLSRVSLDTHRPSPAPILVVVFPNGRNHAIRNYKVANVIDEPRRRQCQFPRRLRDKSILRDVSAARNAPISLDQRT